MAASEKAARLTGLVVEPVHERFLASVEDELHAFLDREEAKARRLAPELGVLADEVRQAVTHGGKRIRPLLCRCGWLGAGGGESEPLVRAAASLELVHAFALAHDDIIDSSAVRRGRPSMHRAFETVHAASGWRGDPALFGQAAAILGGDLLLSFADQLFYGCGIEPAALDRASPIYEELRSEMIWGQYLDVYLEVAEVIDRDFALRVLHAKSGHYTVQKPLLLGGALADAPSRVMEVYAEYGTAVGEIFQLRDDVLGVFGDPEKTGKPAGDDLREGKRTVLVAEAYAAADEASRAFLVDNLGDREMADSTLAELRRLIVETGALDRLEETIAEATERALAALEGVELRSGAAGTLTTIALGLRDRTA